MSTSEFDDYKVDHLFLLIGENPLPNYVAAKMLLNEGGTAYLVHTTDTEKSAKRLQTILKSELNGFKDVELRSLGDFESDAYYIQEEIKLKLESIESGQIGLNYTGGTKAMSAHSYRALFYEEIEDKTNKIYKRRESIFFSYLDPRRLEMCIDREDNERVHIPVTAKLLSVKLEKVFQIHGWTWQEQSPPIYTPELPNAAKAFAKLHEDEKLIKLWRTWCNNVLREYAKNPSNKNNWLSEKQLREKEELSNLPLQVKVEKEVIQLKEYQAINQALITLGITADKLSLTTVQKQGLKSLESVCKWLDGEWLEHYVLHQVQSIPQNLYIHDSATSFWIKNPRNPKNTKFQFDVAFMRGYQLFVISCTTIERKSDCKSKLFEAYIRAQQLGGTEARVALVCCASPTDVSALETEITNVLNPTPDSSNKNYKLVVFGREDLGELTEGIAEWIRNNEAK
ncbi:MAG: DUF1887 family protein [Cyanomargarita calcarea GSE-NOS-MK-12-04C]|jgi:hypothetical protein|uniref:DUF1887 family protein n=1 Tax=Cyanomargarita calcarea GSE-NOS-MK-12-04C TaxID=2839659 RepID=A0A951QQZ6_9CYAN|nr:DUF1887 family protein [Cyanomargarita calcarea GSE-NOS-MK-12-04C]